MRCPADSGDSPYFIDHDEMVHCILIGREDSTLKNILKSFLKDERGSLAEMVWVIGAALVVAVICLAVYGFAPGTISTLWTTFTGKIQTMLSGIS
jgi:Flp pilus assembly pilin Flp